jgi:(p)ppGpp synthase/HD superfamily hydrolase
MENDDDVDFCDGWIESEDVKCDECGRVMEMPKKDGPFEYYETSGLHGTVCTDCGRSLCDKCANLHKNENGDMVCFDCYDKERRARINLNIHEAIIFATQKHTGQVRKGTDIPYIVHPMEVMQILTEGKCAEEVIIAGILHDTLEDTNTTPEEIRKKFGKQILEIVASETEDKSRTWKERKKVAIDHIKTSSIESKLVCCADKLSNMRSTYADLKSIGNKVWERFNAKKESIKWYYEGILDSLSDISNSNMYQELCVIVEDVFGLDW